MIIRRHALKQIHLGIGRDNRLKIRAVTRSLLRDDRLPSMRSVDRPPHYCLYNFCVTNDCHIFKS